MGKEPPRERERERVVVERLERKREGQLGEREGGTQKDDDQEKRAAEGNRVAGKRRKSVEGKRSRKNELVRERERERMVITRGTRTKELAKGIKKREREEMAI